MVFKIRGLLPFDPVRKIMSIVVETASGDVILFSKGADSSMLSRCNMNEERRQRVQIKVDTMASKSYRTLVLAMRKFD